MGPKPLCIVSRIVSLSCVGGGTIMDRVASMIPPPMAAAAGKTETTDTMISDDDWDKSTSIP